MAEDAPTRPDAKSQMPPRERTTEELAHMTRALIAESLTTTQRLTDHVELLREYLHRLGYQESGEGDGNADE